MNVPRWGEEGCQDFSCSLLSLPRGPVSACSVRRCWQERVFPWQKCNLFYTHTHTHNSTQCPLSSGTENEHNAVSLLRHPSLPSRECWARAPAPRTSGQAGGWTPPAAARQCSGLLWELCLRGNCWSQVQIQIVWVLPSISLYPGQWLLVSVSLTCRDIKFIYLFYLDQM